MQALCQHLFLCTGHQAALAYWEKESIECLVAVGCFLNICASTFILRTTGHRRGILQKDEITGKQVGQDSMTLGLVLFM